jgi:predicted GIY-YIG superfamily endonuclease
MTHWVYVLECEDNFIYVGETQHLFKRFMQHLKGCGASNTTRHKPLRLAGLYKVNENFSFYQYRSAITNLIDITRIIHEWGSFGDNLLIENNITERLFYERRNNHEYGTGNEWYRIRGGKYTKEDLDRAMSYAKEMCERPNRVVGSLTMSTPIDSIPENTIVDRPLCKCNYPCEVKLSRDKTTIYFVCSLKNVWPDFFSYLHINKPCDFWKRYN